MYWTGLQLQAFTNQYMMSAKPYEYSKARDVYHSLPLNVYHLLMCHFRRSPPSGHPCPGQNDAHRPHQRGLELHQGLLSRSRSRGFQCHVAQAIVESISFRLGPCNLIPQTPYRERYSTMQRQRLAKSRAVPRSNGRQLHPLRLSRVPN